MNTSKEVWALVIDDDAQGLRALERRMASAGITAFCTTSPTAALKVIEKNPEKFDFVLTDFHMPDMNGIELIEAIEKLELGVPSILMSGAFQGRPNGLRVIQKPFDFGVLVHVLMELGIEVQI